MLRDQIVALFEEALAARRRGAHGDAARAYLELERIDPTEPLWPKSRAECIERDAPLEECLPALERAAVLYAERGFIVRAIAVYKMILRRAPAHRTALEMLVTLQERRVVGLDRYRRRADSTPPSAGRQSTPRLASGVVEIELEPLHEEASTTGFELDALASAPMFARLSPASLRGLIDAVHLVEMTTDEVLYRHGAPSDSMYVIVEGRVALRAGTPAAPTVAELGAGDVLGVIGLYAGIERPTTAIALEPTRLLELPRRSLEAQDAGTSELRHGLRELARERMLAVLLAVHPLFTRVRRRSSRTALANRFRLFEVRGGVRLVPPGAPVDHLFLVMSGRFEVVGSDSFVVAALGPGMLVGESEFLSRTAAVMPIVATTRSLVLGLSHADFQEITTSDPTFLEEVVREAHAPVWDPTLIS